MALTMRTMVIAAVALMMYDDADIGVDRFSGADSWIVGPL